MRSIQDSVDHGRRSGYLLKEFSRKTMHALSRHVENSELLAYAVSIAGAET